MTSSHEAFDEAAAREAELREQHERATRAPRLPARDTANGTVAGVCAGIANHFEADVRFIRLLAALGLLVSAGVVGVAYLTLWALMPAEGAPPGRAAPSAQRTPLLLLSVLYFLVLLWPLVWLIL
ncbi:MAG TPA: PspC domain-containing protein [Acidimicrobiales bacterium]|nr:PspC domain-containing protein [Acidimicrobiales bacterium]